MNGNKTIMICPSCGHQHEPRGKAMTRALVCANCNLYFRAWNSETVEFVVNYKPDLIIGSKGKFEGFTYEVMGFAVKQERRYRYKWREYLLFNPFRGYAFLSEYEGNWNFIWPLEQDPRLVNSSKTFTTSDGSNYYLYQKYAADVVFARGEFFFDVFGTADASVIEEFISPPFLLERESSADGILWSKGEYLSPNEVANAFSISRSYLPHKQGRGYTQSMWPSHTANSLIKVGIAIGLILLIAQIFLASSNREEKVFSQTFYKGDSTQKVITTPSFTLEEDFANLRVESHAPVSNDYFYADYTLVNDETGAEYNFTKEIEYYFGYEGGESWSEGSQFGEALLSQIEGGKYHLNIYPEFSNVNNEFSIAITRDVTTYTNFMVSFILLALYPLFFFIRKNAVEKTRWSSSDYEPDFISYRS